MTELLFQKQTQLERLAAEKAAQQLSLERELDAAREQAERVNRCNPIPPSGQPISVLGSRLCCLQSTSLVSSCVTMNDVLAS